VRSSVPLDRPWSIIGSVSSILVGLCLWRLIYNGADRAVRIWVLHKGKVHKRRLARAMMLSMLPNRRSAKTDS
jgi:hypothetical protein